QLLNKGYTIRFNHDFVAALNYLRDKQVRTYREAPGADRKAMGAALNRYKDPVQYDMMLGRYQAGEGYSVEIYDPNGELVGGEIGTVEGNIYVGDSVFYGDDIELAKVGTYALMESLYQRGQPYADPDMVSPYTKSIGGELVTFPDFRQKILSGPKEKITLPETFDPRDEAYWRTFFGDAARRNNQGLTKKLFLMRSPRPTELTARVAAESRFTHDALNLVFVANEEEAKAIAATTTEPSELPLFIIPNREIAKNEDTLAYLKSELSAETPAKVFFVKHAKYPDIDVIKTKMFADFMAFD
ncbi:MAG TPA: hypothetical protein PKC28_08390, partial [Bdellovibrionales bacterium]|nr:hypothetical protein [Bdellovibrionales bacterium]